MGCRTQDGGLVLGILLTAKEEGKRRGAARQHLGLAPDAGGGGAGGALMAASGDERGLGEGQQNVSALRDDGQVGNGGEAGGAVTRRCSGDAVRAAPSAPTAADGGRQDGDWPTEPWTRAQSPSAEMRACVTHGETRQQKTPCEAKAEPGEARGGWETRQPQPPVVLEEDGMGRGSGPVLGN